MATAINSPILGNGSSMSVNQIAEGTQIFQNVVAKDQPSQTENAEDFYEELHPESAQSLVELAYGACAQTQTDFPDSPKYRLSVQYSTNGVEVKHKLSDPSPRIQIINEHTRIDEVLEVDKKSPPTDRLLSPNMHKLHENTLDLGGDINSRRSNLISQAEVHKFSSAASSIASPKLEDPGLYQQQIKLPYGIKNNPPSKIYKAPIPKSQPRKDSLLEDIKELNEEMSKNLRGEKRKKDSSSKLILKGPNLIGANQEVIFETQEELLEALKFIQQRRETKNEIRISKQLSEFPLSPETALGDESPATPALGQSRNVFNDSSVQQRTTKTKTSKKSVKFSDAEIIKQPHSILKQKTQIRPADLQKHQSEEDEDEDCSDLSRASSPLNNYSIASSLLDVSNDEKQTQKHLIIEEIEQDFNKRKDSNPFTSQRSEIFHLPQSSSSPLLPPPAALKLSIQPSELSPQQIHQQPKTSSSSLVPRLTFTSLHNTHNNHSILQPKHEDATSELDNSVLKTKHTFKKAPTNKNSTSNAQRQGTIKDSEGGQQERSRQS
ncbi:hypothetical protein FGO68_gene16679 [Halteria grandinella]|uniref:Uncharacterized protein n=1 Tax=Halteria grandinella TaxID=5974 RepID=A0A8J8P0R2_HALGN|nr:hypothetical protein FGO68_gene16679 [Halteria grandinella]